MSASIQAVILGASGYVGGELLRLIAGHPDLELAAAVSESCRGQPIAGTCHRPTATCRSPDTMTGWTGLKMARSWRCFRRRRTAPRRH